MEAVYLLVGREQRVRGARDNKGSGDNRGIGGGEAERKREIRATGCRKASRGKCSGNQGKEGRETYGVQCCWVVKWLRAWSLNWST